MDAKKSRELCIRKMCSSSAGKVTPTPPPPRMSSVASCSDKSGQLEEATTVRIGATTDSRRSSNSDAENDAFTTIHFKAAALEAAASSGLLIDWQHMKSFMICGAKSNEHLLKASECDGDEDGRGVTESSLEEKSVAHKTKRAALDAVHKEFSKAISDDSSFCSSCDEDYDVLFVPDEMPDTEVPEFNLPIEDDDAPSIVDEADPMAALSKILVRSYYNPLDEHFVHLPLFFKTIVSLTQLSLRKDNLIEMEIKKSCILEYSKNKDRALSPFMDISNIHVKHHSGEFFTFCSCKKCSEYREVVVHVMVEQFKSAHMVIMLLDALIRAYSPMLKNDTAHNKFEELLDSNKGLHWITCGFIYTKKMEQMDFIYDESLSENMILVLFSSILMVNNPVMLLQVLAFHIECIVKAYAEGFLEIVEPDNNRIPAQEMLNYILDGYDDLCRISDHISTYFFTFDRFLNSYHLDWTLLCQRLYQQHVFMNLTDTMLACIITLKEEEVASRHAKLIRKYIQFDDRMCFVERCWTNAWLALNKFNLSEVERKRRKSQLTVHRIFDTVVQDAIAFSLQESDDDHDFYDFEWLENRRLAWQNLMVYTKMKWPNGFFELPNTLVCDDKCKKCNVLLEYHSENCKCITCSIAGGPLPPRRNADHTCYKCLAHSMVDKDMQLYESKIVNVCASDDFHSFEKNTKRQKNTTLEQLGKEVSATITTGIKNEIDSRSDDSDGTYHISWALFPHLKNRKSYRYDRIDERYFCHECSLPACMLACKILNNELNPELALSLMQYYQPITMTEEELRAVLPNIMLYNSRMRGANSPYSTSEINDFIVKSYWVFVLSVYATYFMEMDRKCPVNLKPFELLYGDIQVTEFLEFYFYVHEKNKNDTFPQFLNRVKSLSPFTSKTESDYVFSLDIHTDEFQRKLDQFLDSYKQQSASTLKENLQTPMKSTTTLTPNVNAFEKKTTKEKSKKCCFDHADIGEHCKENHTSKKRLKKECSHVRMNETRDRLRKKLSLLVNARKNVKTVEEQKPQEPPQNIVLPIAIKQPPSLKSVATAAAVASCGTKAKVAIGSSSTNSGDIKDDSLKCLSSLCKRFSHLQTSKVSNTMAGQLVNKKQNINAKEALVTAAKTAYLDFNKPLHSIKNTTKAAKTSNDANSDVTSLPISKLSPDENSSAISNQTKRNTKSTNDTNGLDVVSEIYELIDIYSKDQSKVKKWINETLSFIEGSSAMSGNGKKQPQTTNPKKAAKKAKQKQRKEEEKRIAELQDLRWQFHDIYFKEFTDKHKLKALKLSKKRDKKKIGELEVNIKKLQRAKAKVETGILELIATVKQTNTEFKFSYLPTKEQQVKKLQELESTPATVAESATAPKQLSTPATATTMPFNGLAAANISSIVNNYGIPFVNNTTQFPYHLDFQAHAATNAPAGINDYGGILRAPIAAPMCYAPTQPQKLSPDVVAAMAANAAASNANVDPSKRIVTIRRINLPNVPEPQVTVTAKGSSPDKDKLLYTFVNGQLVQTESASIPATSPPTALLTPLPPTSINTPMSMYSGVLPKQPTESVFRLPLPPQTKTQKKKERRLLAKLSAEKTSDDFVANSQHQDQGPKSSLMNNEQKNKINTKTKKHQSHGEQFVENETSKQIPKQPMSGKKHQHNPVPYTSNMNKRLRGDRSASATTTCSVETSSSATPLSSHVTTRENSVCSIKPTGPKKSQTKNVQHTQQLLQNKNVKQQTQTTQMKVGAKVRPRAPSPPVRSPEVCSSQAEVNNNNTEKCEKKKKHSLRKLVDQGQFDNNPFKSLHMQDSDTDWYSSGDDDVSIEDDKESSKLLKSLTTATQVSKPTVKQAAPVVKPTMPSKELAPKCSQGKNVTKETTSNTAVSANVKSNRSRDFIQKHNKDTITTANKNSNSNSNSGESTVKTKTILQTVGETACKSKLLQPQQQQQTPCKVRESLNRKQNADNSKNKRMDNQLPDERPQQVDKSNKRCSNMTTRSNNVIRSNNSNVRRQKKPPSTSTSVNTTAEANVEINLNKPMSKRAQRQAQRRQKTQHKVTAISDCGAGIPNHMDYFNPNDVIIPSAAYISSNQNVKQQQQHYSLAQQMQNLNISNAPTVSSFTDIYGNAIGHKMQPVLSANVSIMDQLNRGVQVENLSLPPGITLTKVDPVKSEQLRQKSESIKKLSKPLQPPQQPITIPTAFNAHPGAAIIAPTPVSAVPGYYGLQYGGVTASGMDPSGIIMVEAKTSASSKTQSKQTAAAAAAAAAAASAGGPNGKTTKNKKRRNKAKTDAATRDAANIAKSGANLEATSEMITLRNPMFHSGPAAAAATILQQPGLLPNRAMGGLPMPTPLPMDQPAAIIKNENGMFTIRNPALHQAVTNGLALGGYRQFGNVNYYTPQEAAAEAARATQQNAEKIKAATSAPGPANSVASTFSYFSSASSDTSQTAASTTLTSGTSGAGGAELNASKNTNNGNNMHNTISISCTNVNNIRSGLSGDAAVIARPASANTKCISAIGSEVKSAQQQKQKSKECFSQSQWINFGPDQLVNTMALNTAEHITCTPGFLNTGNTTIGGLPNVSLQEKYQQSSYYNGFDVFPTGKASNQGNSLFDASSEHMHHNCGDDSPPPTITGYNSYLDGIPNTGVIRYDDATFLKNLIPGQNLNNEVSIHDVNDSNFSRNANTSPVAHRVEITPVFTSRPTSTNLYEQQQQYSEKTPLSQSQQSFIGYRENVSDFGHDGTLFTQSNLLNIGDTPADVDHYQPFNYDFENTNEKVIDFNDLLLKKGSHNHSPRTSPYLDESTLENFVQNMNTLQIGTSSADEKCSIGLNGSSSNSSAAGNTNSSGGVGGQSNSSNGGWW